MSNLGWRGAVVAALIGLQLGAIGYARTTDTRYLAWAPYDQISRYEVEVVVDGEPLPADEVAARYPLGLFVVDGAARGRENRAIAHVHHLIRRVETITVDPGLSSVTVRAVTNGEARVWRWTP